MFICEKKDFDLFTTTEDRTVTVCVLKCAVTVRNDEGDLLRFQEDEVRPQHVDEAVLGEEGPALPDLASQPEGGLGVLRLPGIGRGDDQQAGVRQHLLDTKRKDYSMIRLIGTGGEKLSLIRSDKFRDPPRLFHGKLYELIILSHKVA